MESPARSVCLLKRLHDILRRCVVEEVVHKIGVFKIGQESLFFSCSTRHRKEIRNLRLSLKIYVNQQLTRFKLTMLCEFFGSTLRVIF